MGSTEMRELVINKLLVEIATHGEATLVVEAHDGICWYTMDVKVFKTLVEIRKYFIEWDHEDCYLWVEHKE